MLNNALLSADKHALCAEFFQVLLISMQQATQATWRPLTFLYMKLEIPYLMQFNIYQLIGFSDYTIWMP